MPRYVALPSLCDASEAALRATLASAPAWRDGDYVDTPGAMRPYMATLRVATLKRYGIEAELARRFPTPAAREAETRAWPPNGPRSSSRRAADADPGLRPLDVRPRLPAMRAPLLYVNSRSDSAFPP